MPVLNSESLRPILKEAGALALKMQNSPIPSWQKAEGRGIVSQADLIIDEKICTALNLLSPKTAILSEEQFRNRWECVHESYFIIDPIDGTTAFLNGQSDFSISIAYCKQGRIQFSGIYAPASDEIFLADLGKGARRNAQLLKMNAHGNGKILLKDKPEYQAIFAQLQGYERSYLSSIALRMASIAADEYDAMIVLRPSWDWDLAAGQLLIEEAGGVVQSLAGAILYNQPQAQQSSLVAGKDFLVKELLTIVENKT